MNTEDCFLPEASNYAASHFFLWYLTWVNASMPALFWFLFFKIDVDSDPVSKAILERNFWWFDTAWPLVIWGHIATYAPAAFLGFFSWFGVPMFDSIYEFWITTAMNYLGTIVHFVGSLSFLIGAWFWVDNHLVSVLTGWIIAGGYAGWTVFTFILIGSTQERSKTFMFLRHCGDECFAEFTAEEEEIVIEIDDTATTFISLDF